MQKIILSERVNYIGCFLTFHCQLHCQYCINKFGEFKPNPGMLSADEWIKGLSRIQTRQDLPITLQGGEPTLHVGFYELVNALYKRKKHLDLLTNGTFDVRIFSKRVTPEVFKRKAKYASIRFSFHNKTPLVLAQKIWHLKNQGYEVGLWSLKMPVMAERNARMKEICSWLNIDYREKEFLGWIGGGLSGTYKYKDACSKKFKKEVLCRTSELLIAPSGYIYRCHADLYADRNRRGHILDKEIKLTDFSPCDNYGHCNPCDCKLKFDRFQRLDHCAVEIKEF